MVEEKWMERRKELDVVKGIAMIMVILASYISGNLLQKAVAWVSSCFKNKWQGLHRVKGNQ